MEIQSCSQAGWQSKSKVASAWLICISCVQDSTGKVSGAWMSGSRATCNVASAWLLGIIFEQHHTCSVAGAWLIGLILEQQPA